MSTANPRPWICPACARTVPGRIDTCYCGSLRPLELATDPATTHDSAAAGVKVAVAAAAIVVLAVGARYYVRPTPLPVATSAARPVAPAKFKPRTPVRVVTPQAERAPEPAAPPLEDTVERAMPSIVMVQTSNLRGSGFFTAPDLIVTNAHVIAGARTAAITTRNGTHLDAKVVFLSEPRDLAFLQIPREAGGFPALPLGRSTAVRLAQPIVALGWAESLSQSTVTRGVVTALRIDAADRHLVQTDAVPNHGDSGGPLLDRNGNVIGVTTFRAEAENGQAGFAIAIDDVKPFFAYVPPNVSAPAATADAPATAAPASTAPSPADARRFIGLQHYDDALVLISMNSDRLDGEWSNYKMSCGIASVPPSSGHEWTALYDPQSPLHKTATWCAGALSAIEQRARAINTAMATAAELARQSGVYAGDLRTLRARHHLDWAGWN